MQELKDILSFVLLMHMKNSINNLVVMAAAVGVVHSHQIHKTEAFILLGTTIDFIGCWLKALEQNFIEHCHMYLFNMELLYQKIPVKLPK